jgi:NAD(P)-dependent dehydrogenase (short-subunit alcohol dehydrogenase family)
LASHGAEVYGISKTEAHLASLREECPGVRTFCQDLADWNGLRAVLDSLPTMDGLVNNAAVNVLESVLDLSEESID